MGTTLNRHAYQRLIDEDLEWLLKQPGSLERDHIEAIVRRSPENEYGSPSAPRSRSRKQKIEDALRDSDLTAQLADRQDIVYGHHDMIPRGEHVARLKAVNKES